MKKIAIIFGTDGGYTEDVCKRLSKYFGEDRVDLIEIVDTDVETISSYDYLILASSTWHDGHLQDDWTEFSAHLDEIDFTNKTIALLGLGNQEGYGDTFCDSIGLFYEKVKAGKVVGATSTEGYDFEESCSVVDGKFLGLCIDEDIQDELTEERLEKWYQNIKQYFDK